MASRDYYTLAASLPALPHFERATRLPINEVRLRRSMSMLEPDDGHMVMELTRFIAWNVQPLERTDAQMVDRYAELSRFMAPYPGLVELIQEEMGHRTILVALRRRLRGMGIPGRHEKWGVGPWVEHIMRNWNHPDFKLGVIFPWVPKVRVLLESGQALELQRLFMTELWRKADAVAMRDPFAFEAIVAYLFKWGVINLWLVNNREIAAERFNSLILEVTSGQEQLFDNK
jgi:hypothetical protein